MNVSRMRLKPVDMKHILEAADMAEPKMTKVMIGTLERL